MSNQTLHARIVMRHDTPENWYNNNPILRAGEIGVAISEDSGHCILKIGNGIHPWNELSLELGTAASSNSSIAKGAANTVFSDNAIALGRACVSIGSSVQQATESIKKLSKTLSDVSDNSELNTVKESTNYIKRAEPVQDLRSELKTINSTDTEFNMTTVFSDASFDF